MCAHIPELPSNISTMVFSPKSSTELDVMWDEPDEELSHGTIIRYNIGIRKYG